MTWLVVGAVVPSMAVCWAAAWLLRRLAPRLGLLDRPGHRKVHRTPTPTGGGLAIWLGIVAPLALGHLALWILAKNIPPAWLRPPDFIAPHLPGLLHQAPKLWVLLAGGTALLCLGLADDRRGLDWRLRLGVQILVAAVMASLGWRADLIEAARR